YESQGLYAQAEPLYIEAKEKYEKVLGKQNPDYATSCNNLAALYESQGLYARAEPLLIEAKEIREKVLGKQHPDYATSCNNLGVLYLSQGAYDKAESMLTEAKNIQEQVLGKSNYDYSNSCNNLGLLYQSKGLYDKAESLLLEAKNIKEQVLGRMHPSYALSCNNLANLYREQKVDSKAELLFTEAKKIQEKVLGEQHPSYAQSCNNLALLYKSQGLYAQAEPLYREATDNKLQQINTTLPRLSERERKAYLKSINLFFKNYYSFALTYYPENPEISGHLFDVLLVQKGILFESTQKMRKQILASQDEALIEDYNRWKGILDFYGKAIQLTIEERAQRNISIDSLLRQANDLERSLSRRSDAFAKATQKRNYKWTDIKQNLAKNEVIVEILRVEGYNAKLSAADTQYVALIITPKTKKQPEMIFLDNGSELEGKFLRFYRNSVSMRVEDTLSYNKFWQPIANALARYKGIEKVYFSPDGLYHQINIGTLYNPQTEKYLEEELSIHLLSSSRDIISLKGKSDAPLPNYRDYLIHLFGYPDYAFGLPEEDNKPYEPFFTDEDELEILMDSDTSRAFNFMNAGGSVSKLPGTRKEIEAIYKYAQENGAIAYTYTDEKASESAIKNLENPDILHIATHGFFLSDLEMPKNEQEFERVKYQLRNPLLRSGLLLAGAEQGFRTGENVEVENGILTAQEALSLTLDRTDLVVLSACETGLGEIQNGEGVFGLQRAFQQAGAKTVLMSLWKVDDTATQLMMTEFYKNLLSGKSKRAAFKAAQLSLKAKFPEPYFWGAFVMVGE
ncbi:MAG: CHAT domain-containing protein, partial [Bernardetiaceae bacterium]|nr:CHAT domain-containing protein [Bernardetiaceae bacterium]